MIGEKQRGWLRGWLRRGVVLGAIAAVTCVGQALAAPEPVTFVVCAPGYPGSTEEAQQAMDTLAAAMATSAGWAPGELAAVYYPSEKAGMDRLQSPRAALALVPLPFYLKHGATLRLTPRLQGVLEGGDAAEPWSLVAARGAVRTPASLAGFEIISLAGYAPRFVRGPALASWGELPRDVTITFSGRVLSGLRKASKGAKVALLLDRTQADALPTLAFASKLEVVARSKPLPVSVLCSVGARMPAKRLAVLVEGLRKMEKSAEGAQALRDAQLSRFVAVDAKALAEARAAFDRARE